MFGEDKNLKDVAQDSVKDKSPVAPSFPIVSKGHLVSYTKTDKLITALYMVTDMMNKDEPLRLKLRTLGADIVSDVHSTPILAVGKIRDVMSFLDIASSLNLISEMNFNILKKEFSNLFHSVESYTNFKNNQISIDNFFNEDDGQVFESKTRVPAFTTFVSQPVSQRPLHNGQPRTRIGVQKGDTLLKALSEKTNNISKENLVSDFNTLKSQRRDDLVKIIKDTKLGYTIKDISKIIKDKSLASLISFSEKTLQRELMSMVKDGVLNKVGEKRWSKYFVKNIKG